MKTRISHTVTFGRAGNAADGQLHGWSGGEDGFTWMIGPESALVVPAQEAPHGLFVEIRGIPFTGRQRLPNQPISVKANGQPVGTFIAESEGVWALYAPPTACDRQTLTLTFEHPAHASPAELGLVNDDRQLAFAAKHVRILVAAEAYRGEIRRASAVPLACMDEERTEDALAEVSTLLGMPAGELAMRFENLGSNCEFGFFQRRCGVEPLGLLRFSSTRLHELVRGLDAGFASIGAPANVHVELEGNGSVEWIAFEDNYKLRYHTFVWQHQADAARTTSQEAKKLAFLGRKLVDDVMDGLKVFVFQRDRPPLSEAEVLPLFLALNRKARNSLLWVKVADRPDQVGTVVETTPGLLRGYVRRLAPGEMVPDLSVPDWLAVCANAELLRRNSSTAAAAGADGQGEAARSP